MRKLLFLYCIGLLASCELFTSKEVEARKIINKELLEIDWNDVDQYPLFDDCDETAIKQVQRECFQQVLSNYFSEALEGLRFQVDNDLNDTMHIDFLIDEHGFISVLNAEENASISNEISDFNTEISNRLNDLTTVAPALKRGIPVSLKFRLPIVIYTN
ncbi:hypothetical protein HME9304_01990 [Flagellimonas maritima]|uniref:TonB C-terminal domain-containing protein n=1 Tax=Flagellimonas maritima TaxID=1383885 RepID=A0A2Z4LT26_9FLAO|nr:hypothetical protein [Allomuricauda aurantiaca]AWX44983.1 hypothetical protein HME9304_01990 [Allomuricauda aurantiaca]